MNVIILVSGTASDEDGKTLKNHCFQCSYEFYFEFDIEFRFEFYFGVII